VQGFNVCNAVVNPVLKFSFDLKNLAKLRIITNDLSSKNYAKLRATLA